MQECENQKRITAVAIGDFDGMHRAHNIVCTGAEQVIIYCVHNRFSLLQKSIFQRRYPTAVFADFNAIRNMEGRQFVEDVLIGRFGAGMVLCGFNFRFGKNAAWDAMRLRAYLEDRGAPGLPGRADQFYPYSGGGAGRRDGAGGGHAGL